MTNLDRLKEIIKKSNISAKIYNFASAYDGLGAKYTEGLSTLLFYTDKGDYIAVLKRDDRKIDNKKLRKLLGIKSLNLCSIEQLREIGFESGDVSPLLLGDIRIIVDKSMEEMRTVYCGTGSTKHTLEIKFNDLLRVIKDYKLFNFTVPDPSKVELSDMLDKKNINNTKIKKYEELSLGQVKPANTNFKGLLEKIKKTDIKNVVFIKHKPIKTVEEGISILGIDFGEGASTLIYKTENGFIGFYRRDDKRVDSSKLKGILKVRNLRLASEDELKKHFSFEIGAVGIYQKELKYLMDKSLFEKEYVYGGTGDPCYDIKIKPEDLQKLTNAKIVGITESSARAKKRILTGDTPSGKLHLGHFVGTLENRVKLQKEYDTFILLANIHAYANDYSQAEKINQSTYEVFLDNLAVGIDPNISTIFLESGIPELYELYGFFLTMVKHGRAMRNPTVKEEIIYKKLDPSLGFISYPILQAADILGFNADLVPVGEDQLPIIEQVREIAKDFNRVYGGTFVVPDAKVGRVARLIGTDGKMKMSKSGGNSILLSENEKTLKEKVHKIYTDPKRIHSTYPGKVKGNPVFIYHDAFNKNKEEVDDLKERYKRGKVGDIEVKDKLYKVLNNFLKPIRERRKYYEDRPEEAREILIEGTKKARKVVQEVLSRFLRNVGINNLIKD